jgi:uncharacterized membrane protein
MLSTVFGLPAHPLIVHAVVVLVPLAALSALLVAVWPAARDRYAPLALAVATLALISVPLATHTGELLESHVRPSPFVERHTEMADGLLPFVAVLWLALAVLVAARRFGASREARWPRYVAGGAAVLAVAGAIASGVQVVRIGDSGSRAAWHGVATTNGQVSGPHH